MGRYFGTDGFRGEAGIDLTADHAYKVGRFLGWYYNALRERNGNNEPARIVIGKDEPIRVAQIMGKLWAGGVEMVVFNYYRAIDKSKIQFDFYYDADSTVEPPQNLIDMGARFYKIPPYQKLPQYIRELKKHLKENQYLIVHSHLNTLSVFPLFVAWMCRVPVRVAHNHSVPSGKELKRDALKYFLRIFGRVFPTDYFACSEKAGRWMFGNRNYDAGKVVVIKNATDFERFRVGEEIIEKLKKQLGLNDKFVIGHIGRFTFAKNHEFLLDVFKKISDVRNDAVLLLVGDGELNQTIHNSVKTKGLENRVVFAGQVSNPELYYRLANVIVVPSVFEGLSLATIESQIAGVPVVVSDAIPEEAIISNGVVRLSLQSPNWVSAILSMENKIVVLNENSKDYDIYYAVKKLEDWYEDKVKECQMFQ